MEEEKFKKDSKIFTSLGPSFGTSLRNWMKMQVMNGFGALKTYPRVFLVNLVSAFGIPFRVYERWRLDKKIIATKITESPVFILGHWRSGTTHLHNLLVQDDQFGFITMLQAAFPNSFMSTTLFRSFMKKFIPSTRPMDNMRMRVDTAQEEEMALGNMFPYSFYNGFYFPKRMMEYYYKYIRFKNIPNTIIENWKKVYTMLLQKATLFMQGRRLVLKNPANTGRIKFLLDLYPDAKFIHIYRNPFVVYASTRHFYRKVVEYFMLQKITREEIEENIFKIYRNLMSSYFHEKRLIPEENLIEVKFEDLEKNAIEQIENIYSELQLFGFERAKLKIKYYLKSLADYKKNKFYLSQEVTDKIANQWKFTINKWDYDFPDDIIIT
jgi:hypothetical protein